jgi:hypothetical protein
MQPILRTGKAPEGTLDAVRREAREIMELARGKDGESRRKNAVKVKVQMAEAWKPDGRAHSDFCKFLDSLNLA